MVESCAPKGKPRRKLKRGQPNSRSKLTAELSAKICGYVADGMSWQDAASMVGVHRNVSSHMNGAESECIVPSGHGAHQNP